MVLSWKNQLVDMYELSRGAIMNLTRRIAQKGKGNRAWKAGSVMIKKTKAACITLVIPFYQRFSDFAGMLKLLKRSTRFWCYDDATFSGSRHHLWGVKIVIALVALQLHNGSKSHLSCQLCGSALWAQWVGNYWGIWRWDELFFGLVIKCAVQRMSLHKHTQIYTKRISLKMYVNFQWRKTCWCILVIQAREIQYCLQYFFNMCQWNSLVFKHEQARAQAARASTSLKILLFSNLLFSNLRNFTLFLDFQDSRISKFLDF